MTEVARVGEDDLRAAVAAGVLSEAQAARLLAIANGRRGAREDLAPNDEPFELFRGFNEVFVMTGLGILAFGWVMIAGATTLSSRFDPADHATVSAALASAVTWIAAEYFIRTRRMVGPAILLTGFWTAASVIAFAGQFAEILMVARRDFASLPLPLALSVLAILAWWWRFRVPIALTLAALGVFAAIVLARIGAGAQPDDLRDLFLLTAGSGLAWITLGTGLAIFALAMAFDMSDPHRVTRRSAQGFWLHILAAPAIVNTVALTLFSDDGGRGTLVAFLAAIAVVAIVIDRRSFLIAGIGYVVALAVALGDDGAGVGLTILLLGAGLVLTGALWERIRARLLRALGPALPLSRLPPAA